MRTLRESLMDYLAMRRALGFKLRATGRALSHFVSFMEKQEASFITVHLSLQWAQQSSSVQPSTWAERLSFVRGFARYCIAIDARTEIPPYSLLPHRAKRARPYLYTSDEVRQLLEAALNLPTVNVLKKETYYCLLGLLSVSGIRISEALGLHVSKVDLGAGVLTVEGSKFGKSRLVPLHASTQKALSDYLLCRNEFLNGLPSEYFFINMVGKRLDEGTVRRTFYLLSRQIYLTAYPELMGASVKRLEERWEVKP